MLKATEKQKRLKGNEIVTTKYNVFNFLPKNLFEQFHRFANVYFFFIAILNFVPQGLFGIIRSSTVVMIKLVEAIDPWMALGPVIFIFSVTAIKDGVENYRRYLSDKKINGLICKVLQDGKFIHKKWKHIRVGDIIELNLNDVIPGIILNCINYKKLLYTVSIMNKSGYFTSSII